MFRSFILRMLNNSNSFRLVEIILIIKRSIFLLFQHHMIFYKAEGIMSPCVVWIFRMKIVHAQNISFELSITGNNNIDSLCFCVYVLQWVILCVNIRARYLINNIMLCIATAFVVLFLPLGSTQHDSWKSSVWSLTPLKYMYIYIVFNMHSVNEGTAFPKNLSKLIRPNTVKLEIWNYCVVSPCNIILFWKI